MAALSPRVNVNSELQGSKTINNSLSFSSSSSQEGILLASGATESVSLGWQPLPDLVSHNGMNEESDRCCLGLLQPEAVSRVASLERTRAT